MVSQYVDFLYTRIPFYPFCELIIFGFMHPKN